MTRTTRSLLIAIAGLTILAGSSATAQPTTQRFSAPWQEQSSQGNCNGPNVLTVNLYVGECSTFVQPNLSTGTTATRITTDGNRTANTVAFFTRDVPAVPGSTYADVTAHIRLDDVRLQDPGHRLIGIVWVSGNDCSCGAWSDQVVLADRDVAPTPGRVVAVTASLKRPAAATGAATYQVIVEIVALADGNQNLQRRTLDATVTASGFDLTSR